MEDLKTATKKVFQLLEGHWYIMHHLAEHNEPCVLPTKPMYYYSIIIYIYNNKYYNIIYTKIYYFIVYNIVDINPICIHVLTLL